ncbi:hypothetical protein SAMN04489761_1103 [Tenacibaculum sp. MAR_2009_124]|uniref:hypothetical protein n=1 Tax=Tenacibaculum sp. MAR_2009_124 TaxID=1250059 RepID=UPI00089A8662|nr:hypothetical protein [Tenacibaculum sp. MAR_2009_124]SEB50664.1 hypothetical protein SAMN04489761_1103 [Tenacibaculum sp. MAR_2009_124]
MKKTIDKKRRLKQIFIILFFITVNFGIVSLLSTIYYEFNSGADRSRLLHIDLRVNDYYQPKIKINGIDTEGRAPNREIIRNIKNDYIKSWYVKKYAMQNNDVNAIEDFYTDSAQAKIQRIIKHNITNKINIHSTSIDHDMTIKFLSEDGQLAYIDDKNVHEQTYFFKDNKQIHGAKTIKNYKSILLLEDGFWRVRHLKSLPKNPDEQSNHNDVSQILEIEKKITHVVQPKQTLYRLTKIYNTTKKKLIELNPNKRSLTNNILLKNDTILVKILKEKITIDQNKSKSQNIRFPNDFKIKGINYYPQKTPWFEFWKQYDTIVVNKDFKLIKNLQLNTIRIFIPYELFGKEKVSKTELNNLISTLDLAHKNNLKVIVTFFDFYSNYQVLDYTICDRHIEKIIRTIKDHPALLQYDIKNEPDLDFKLYGKQKVINWLSFIAGRMKYYDKETPITIGWYSPKEASNLSDQLDFVSFHYYKSPEEFSPIFKELEKKVKKPIVIQEFGKHSYNSIWNLYSNSEKKQAKYHKEIQESFGTNGVEHFVSWTLYDFPKIDTKVFGRMPHKIGPQKNYGFINNKGKLKKAAKYISGVLK